MSQAGGASRANASLTEPDVAERLQVTDRWRPDSQETLIMPAVAATREHDGLDHFRDRTWLDTGADRRQRQSPTP